MWMIPLWIKVQLHLTTYSISRTRGINYNSCNTILAVLVTKVLWQKFFSFAKNSILYQQELKLSRIFCIINKSDHPFIHFFISRKLKFPRFKSLKFFYPPCFECLYLPLKYNVQVLQVLFKSVSIKNKTLRLQSFFLKDY